MTFFRERLLLAGTAANGDIQIWDAETVTCVSMLKARDSLVDSIAFSRHGSTLVSGYDNNLIRLWNAYSGECIGTFEGHSADISCVALSDDGAFLASGSSDCTLRVWNTGTKSCQVLKVHLSAIGFVAISCDGFKIASASEYGVYGGELMLWDTKTGSCININPQASAPMSNLIFSSDASFLIAACESEIYMWEVETGVLQKIMKSDGALITTLAISPGHTTIASGSDYATVQLWDNTLPESTAVDIETNRNRVTYITCSQDESKVASMLSDGTFIMWDMETGNCLQTLEGNFGPFSTVVFSQDDSMLAFYCRYIEKPVIQIWNLSTGQHSDLSGGFEEEVQGFAFSHDCLKFVSVSGRDIRIWNTQTGDCERSLQTSSVSVASTALAFSEDNLLVAVGYRGLICIWNLETGKSWSMDTGHVERISSVLFSPDGSKLATSSVDGTVYLWGTQDLIQMLCLKTRSRKPWMRFSPDGARLMVEGMDVSSSPTDLAQFPTEAQQIQEQSNDPCFWCDDSREWIMRSSRRVLWLPPELRGPQVVGRKIIAIANACGGVTIVHAR
ncbi:hypothetical protein FH972_026287 [Carpinus fangiana]|uniref:Uncharacterized protein n=1 Tax=Carpinus fangiana TaxID=176857 RepID=A0A5N6L421_9ROSI|nr:hypothetical protein FH972_026287 [Carpinus fangiana]